MAPDAPVLELEGVTGGYGGAEILHGVSVQVGPSEVVVLIGPNGAGKSSVMNAVLGRLHIDDGRVRLAGRDITGVAPEQVVRRGVCYVPQTENVFPNLSVNENLEMGAYIRTDDFRPRIEEMYELFPPLAERRRAPAGTLSGGQRQMVAIAKALMVDPVILLLDEPTAGLSPRFRGDIFRVVRELNARGTPILMVEQNARQALGIADRGYVLVDGRNRLEGTGSGLLADPDVGVTFLGGGSNVDAHALGEGAETGGFEGGKEQFPPERSDGGDADAGTGGVEGGGERGTGIRDSGIRPQAGPGDHRGSANTDSPTQGPDAEGPRNHGTADAHADISSRLPATRRP